VSWELVYYGSHVPGETAPQFRAGLDLGFPVPLPHSSIWLRSAAGVANGDRNSVIANFYLGAFGNNYLAAAIAVRHGSLGGPRKRSTSRGVSKRRRTSGLEFHRPAPLQHDAVGRLRGGPRAFRAH
jgi:hypothetical protein